jgi:phosphatidylserine/phosphatidylglycerophosphate/cardiolipin synthase-like enzyme
METVSLQGNVGRLSVRFLDSPDAFPHLKLVIADERRAYIGSANLTFAALAGNVEVGALVEGKDIALLVSLFDTLLPEVSEPSSQLRAPQDRGVEK